MHTVSEPKNRSGTLTLMDKTITQHSNIHKNHTMLKGNDFTSK